MARHEERYARVVELRFFAGLTVIYAISGIAVKHIEDWNPNYVIRTDTVQVGELPAGDNATLAAAVLERMGIGEEPESVVRMAPDQLKVFLDQRKLFLDFGAKEIRLHQLSHFFSFVLVQVVHDNCRLKQRGSAVGNGLLNGRHCVFRGGS